MSARPTSNARATEHAADVDPAFDGFVAQLGTGVIQTSLDGRLIRLNEACARLFGFDDPRAARAAVSNTGAQVYVDPICRVQLIARLLVEGRIDGAVAELRRRDGSTFWASQTLRLITDPVLGERSILSTITDITSVVDQQNALAAAERDYRSIFENATLGIYRSAPDGRQLRANPALWRMHGFVSEAEMLSSEGDLGNGWYVVPGRRAEFGALMERDGRVVSFESEIYRFRTRERIWIRESAWVVRGASDEVLFYEGVVEDITAERAAEDLRKARDDVRMRMQEALAASVERLRAFADIAADWYWESDAAGRFTFVSEGVARIGFDAGSLVGSTHAELPEAIDKSSTGFQRVVAAIARRDSYKDIVYRIRHGDGRLNIVSVSGEPQFDTDGSFLGYRGIGRDVTETHRAREALARSEARFRDAIECMAEGFTIWDADDKLVIENRRVFEILPYLDGPAPPGISFVDAFNDAYRVARPGITDEELDALRADRFAARSRCGTGELQIPGDRIVEFTDRRTSEGGYITTYRDVTALRGAMDKLAESEARFRDFAETTADWFWEQDAELRFTYVSPSNEAISGVSAAAHIGLRRTETRKEGVSEEQWQSHLETLARREPFKDFRYQRTDPQGRRRHLAISGKPVFDSRGAFMGYRGVGRDETELVEAQRALEAALATAHAATEQEQRFATAIAHEFRTPLTIVDGAAQRLLRQLDDPRPEDMRTRIGKIRAAVRNMETLIDTMLDSARLASGKLVPERTRIDLVAFVEQQIRRFDPTVTGREIVLTSTIAQAPVSADARMLEHILTNLLSNAIKYSGSATRVDVAIDPAAGAVRLAVRDHGIGIPEDELPQLFQRFFRASTAKGIPGTGIGLALVHELVQRHDGHIAVESAPGRGSCFTVTLPLATSAASS